MSIKKKSSQESELEVKRFSPITDNTDELIKNDYVRTCDWECLRCEFFFSVLSTRFFNASRWGHRNIVT